MHQHMTLGDVLSGDTGTHNATTLLAERLLQGKRSGDPATKRAAERYLLRVPWNGVRTWTYVEAWWQ